MIDPVPSMVDLGIDQEAAATLLPHLDSFVKWELLRFLHDNPGLEAAVEDLARYTGRDETEVKPAARALHAAKLFDQKDGDGSYSYSLTSDDRMRDMVDQLIRGFVADRLIRLAISSHILKARKEATRLQQVST